jgi:hypothetical protein
MENNAKGMTYLIDRARAKYMGDSAGYLMSTKNAYNGLIQSTGENSLQSIMAGVSYAAKL